MKIGILTWFSAYNYGARAQSYALLSVVREMGHECEFINYEPPRFKKYNRRGNLNCWYPYRRWVKACKCYIRCLRYEKDLRYVPKSKKVNHVREIDALGYDAIIIGSDSVFNIGHEMFQSLYYGVGIEYTPYFFYAPSCESMSIEDELSDEIKGGLRKAKAISVRDQNSAQIVNKAMGITPPVLLDPTFLFNVKVTKKKMMKRSCMLLYSFSNWGKYSSEIRSYAQKHELDIISVGRWCPWADYSMDMASTEEWIGAFEQAEVVMTDSFHGTVFGLKNKKPLVVMAREDKRTKIEEMLKQCGVPKCGFYEGENLEKYIETHMFDYDEVFRKLDSIKEESFTYLKESINLCALESIEGK